jgi:glycosyltransferase involved in cell wall biosynthesis
MTPTPVMLSVVICTYNRCASLTETLASVNACTLPGAHPVELLVIDNNSNDETAAVCARFAQVARMPFRRVVEAAQGLSFARNRGILEAAGSAVIFTDDDVLVNTEWLAVYAREFDDDGTDCVFGRIHADWRGRRPDWFSDALKPAYALLDYGDGRFEVRGRASEFYGANFAVRKSVLTELGAFDVRLGRTKGRLFIGEETRVFIDLLHRGKRIVYNPAIEVHHVIEEARKEKAYLLRYYHDTAESLVYSALLGSPRRRLFGIPFHKAREFARFYLTALPRLASLAAAGDGAGLLALRLQWIRYNRMLGLFLRERVRAPASPPARPT